jgi:hypothetical protein
MSEWANQKRNNSKEDLISFFKEKNNFNLKKNDFHFLGYISLFFD